MFLHDLNLLALAHSGEKQHFCTIPHNCHIVLLDMLQKLYNCDILWPTHVTELECNYSIYSAIVYQIIDTDMLWHMILFNRSKRKENCLFNCSAVISPAVVGSLQLLTQWILTSHELDGWHYVIKGQCYIVTFRGLRRSPPLLLFVRLTVPGQQNHLFLLLLLFSNDQWLISGCLVIMGWSCVFLVVGL